MLRKFQNSIYLYLFGSRPSVWREPLAECEVCGREMLGRNIPRHMLIHKKSRKFQCVQCSFISFDVLELKKHYLKHHNLPMPSVLKLMQQLLKPATAKMGSRRTSLDSETGSSGSCESSEKLITRRSSIATETIQRSSIAMIRRSSNLSDVGMIRRSSNNSDTEIVKEKVPIIKSERSYQVESYDAASELSESSCESNSDIVDSVIKDIPYLKVHERVKIDKGYHPSQIKELMKVFALTWHPSVPQKLILEEKLGVPFTKLRYWFDNNRRRVLKLQERKKNEVVKLEKSRPRSVPDQRLENKYSSTDPDKQSCLSRVNQLTAEGEPVCIGSESDISYCNICRFTCPSRGNLYTHLSLHGLEYKFCSSRTQGPGNGCRKIFTPETFDKHVCSDDAPTPIGNFPLIRGGVKPVILNHVSDTEKDEEDSDCDTDEEDNDENDKETEADLVDKLLKSGKEVCLGYDIPGELHQCNFCPYSCPVRGNLYKHIGSHGFQEIKFCKEIRENSKLSDPTQRGCRKIFHLDTYDLHLCTEDDPTRLGDFKVSRGINPRIRSPMKSDLMKPPKLKIKSKKKFAVPDGSPAKFYCDGYTRLFHRLGSRDKHAFPMNTTFQRNGQLELVYLTAGQMRAVREFCMGSEKYFLVWTLCVILFGL